MNSKPPVIFLALARWDNPYASTAMALAQEMAKERQVFYIENPFTWKDLLFSFKKPQIKRRIPIWLGQKSYFQSIPSLPEQFITVIPPLVLPINWLPKGKIYRFLSRWNNRRVLKRVQKVIKDYGISTFDLINVFQPFYGFDLPQTLQPRRNLYFCVDVIGHSAYINKHGAYLEKEMMQKVDAICTTSSQLQTYAEKHTSRPVYLVPNGVHYGLFSQAGSIPAILEEEKRKIILYTGSIGLRIDYRLLEKIAASFPKNLLLLVGPQSSTFEKNELAKYENVLFTGAKRLEELPGFLSQAACTIIPFKCNELTKGIYPLKINEYLAAGKPVVSTSFSDDLQMFQEVIEIADSHASFIQRIAKVLADDSEEIIQKRKEIAQGNNWEQRLQFVERILNENHDNLRKTIKPQF